MMSPAGSTWDPSRLAGLSFPDWLRLPPPPVGIAPVADVTRPAGRRARLALEPPVAYRPDVRVVAGPYPAHDGGPFLVDVVHESVWFAGTHGPVSTVVADRVLVEVSADQDPDLHVDGVPARHGMTAAAGARVVIRDPDGFTRGWRALAGPVARPDVDDLCVPVVSEGAWWTAADPVPEWWPTFAVWVE